MSWNVTNSKGKIAEPGLNPDYLKRNSYYIQLLNILYKSISSGNETVKDIWTKLRQYKKDYMGKERKYIHGKYYDVSNVCQMLRSVIINQLGIHVTNTPIHNNITEDLLKEGLDMFLYVNYCPEKEALIKFFFYEDLFMNYKAPEIIQTFMGITSQKKEHNNFDKQIYNELDNIFKFDFWKIQIALSSKMKMMKQLNETHFGNVKNNLQNCLTDSKCGEIEYLLSSLGSVQFSKLDSLKKNI
jgi:hypothetical protein